MRKVKMWFWSVAVIASLGLTGCGDSGSSDKLSEEEARAAAMASLAKVLNTVATAVDSVNSTVVESAAMKVVADTGFVKVPVSSTLSNKVIARYRSLADQSTQRLKAARGRIALHGGAEGDTHEGPVNQTELEEFLVFKGRDGNTITWGINADVACDAMDTSCQDATEAITLVQTVSSDTSGTLDVKINGSTLFTIGYAPDSIYVQIDLAELKNLAESNGTTTFDELTAFQGQLRLTLTVLDDTEGEEAVEVAFGIPQAIAIAGLDNGEGVSLDIAQSNKVLALAADAGTGTATIELGLGMVHLVYIDDVSQELSVAHIGALTGTLVINQTEMVATNIGVGDEIYDDKGSDGTKENRLQVSNFGFTVDIATANITLDATLDITATDETGSMRVQAPDGTVLHVDDATDITEVVSGGPVTFTGTGDMAGSLSATAGTCYLNDSAAVGFPITSVSCPL